MKGPAISSSKIVESLAAKHSEDVFVPECKDGPTQTGAGHLRLDAWAMKKSWSNPCVYGYEVKVSRSDFIRDDKWHNYLNYCNSFYFVCPKGLIKPEELPEEAGLIYCLETGKLFTKKKAPFRQVAIPENLFRYLLMCRVRIQREQMYGEAKISRLEYWKDWLETKKEGRQIGYKVRDAIRQHVFETERQNRDLKTENDSLRVFKDRLNELGVNPMHSVTTWDIESAFNKLLGEIKPWMVRTITDAEESLRRVRKLMETNESEVEI